MIQLIFCLQTKPLSRRRKHLLCFKLVCLVTWQDMVLDGFQGLATKFSNTHFALCLSSRFERVQSSLVFCHILSLHTFVWNPCVWFCEHFTTIIIKKPRYIAHMYVAKLVKHLYACHSKLIKCHIETCCDLCTYP